MGGQEQSPPLTEARALSSFLSYAPWPSVLEDYYYCKWPCTRSQPPPLDRFTTSSSAGLSWTAYEINNSKLPSETNMSPAQAAAQLRRSRPNITFRNNNGSDRGWWVEVRWYKSDVNGWAVHRRYPAIGALQPVEEEEEVLVFREPWYEVNGIRAGRNKYM